MPPISSTIRSALGEDLLEVAAAAREHADDHRPAAVEALDLVGALGEQLVERGADGAVAEQADAKRRRPLAASAPSADIAAQSGRRALAAHDHARVAVAAEDHRRARHAVVVVGHRVAVGAGRRRHDHVAGARVVEHARRARSRRRTRSACRRARTRSRRRSGRRRRPRSARRRASGAGCRTCRRRPRPSARRSA